MRISKNSDFQEKTKRLESIIRGAGSAVVAFSGGVDSTLLAYLTHKILKDNMVAVTGRSASVPGFQLKDAEEFAAKHNIPFKIVDTDELSKPGYYENSPNRCFHCKHELFSNLAEIMEETGFNCIFDGTNIDDHGDFRPGLQAARELKVRSPLAEADFTKDDVRALSKEFDLPTWDMPAFACLASRFPYGTKINKEKLKQVELAELALREMGFRQFRVRHHGEVARVELGSQDLAKALSPEMLKNISLKIKAAGFTYVTLDMEGYRSGSLNEPLALKKES